MNGYERLIEALEDKGLVVQLMQDAAYARCPAHDDQHASLSCKQGDNGTALAYCHAGCSFHDVVEALGLSDLNGNTQLDRRVVAQYTYTDEAGEPLYRVNRTEPKGFFQDRLEDGQWVTGLGQTRRVLYDLPNVLRAISQNGPIYILEGEKDVETFKATQTGATATCYLGGAGKWSDENTRLLKDASHLFVVADRDEAGRKHAMLIKSKLPQALILYPREGKDLTDHVYAGGTLADLLDREPVAEDWDDWEEEIPSFDWLLPGILARGTMVWAYGPKESAKSMYLLDVCTRLSHQGIHVTYYSEEMAKAQDKRRLARFGPDKRYFHWKNGRGLDLANEDHLAQVIAENHGTGLIVLDSYERVWNPPLSNENKRAIAFARTAHAIIVDTGATVVVIDHTGFGYRDDSGHLHEERKPRGASAKEQQADMSILFSSLGRWRAGEPYRFRIENMKPGRLENPFVQDLEVVDTPNGGLAVVRSGLGMEPYPKAAEPQKEGGGMESTPKPALAVVPDVEEEDAGSSPALSTPQEAKVIPINTTPQTMEEAGAMLSDPLSVEEARRVRYYVKKGMSRTEARQATAVEKWFASQVEKEDE